MGTNPAEVDGGYEPVQRAAGGPNPDGEFITVTRGSQGERRAYVSAEARDRLGRPEYLTFLVDEIEGRIAIAPADDVDDLDGDGGEEYRYKLNHSSWHVSFEMPLRRLDTDAEERLYAADWTDEGWMVVEP